MKTKKYWIAAVMSAVCLAVVWAARASEKLTDKQWSLAEIKAVYVFVQGVTEETKKVGLTKEQIQTDVEEKLQGIGIKVVSEEEAERLPGNATLYVNISARKRERVAAFVFHVDVGILQKVSLVRDSKIRTMSITWNKGRVGYCPSRGFVKAVRETVGYLMDRFCEDYRAANPPTDAHKES